MQLKTSNAVKSAVLGLALLAGCDLTDPGPKPDHAEVTWRVVAGASAPSAATAVPFGTGARIEGTIPVPSAGYRAVPYFVGRYGETHDSMYVLMLAAPEDDPGTPEPSHVVYEALVRPSDGAMRYLLVVHQVAGQVPVTVDTVLKKALH